MSVRKDVLSWALIGMALVLVAGAAYLVLEPKLRPHVNVHIGDAVFSAQVAKTDEQRTKGLSGKPSLANDEAILFVYDTDGKWPVWMKEMRFPIDIVWLDKDKKVVHIVKNAPPESYPYESFAPMENARYVVELAAGTVAKKAIEIGGQARFDENNIEGLKL